MAAAGTLHLRPRPPVSDLAIVRRDIGRLSNELRLARLRRAVRWLLDLPGFGHEPAERLAAAAVF